MVRPDPVASRPGIEADPTTGPDPASGSQAASAARPPSVARTALPPPPGAGAQQLSQALGISRTVAEVLHRRGYQDPPTAKRFLEPRLADLTPPDSMADRDAAATRLARAVRENERVCVFGDYDCDGITSAATLVEVLRALGGEAVPLLGSRFDGGYGVTELAIDRILQSGASLVVSCDCGSSDHRQLARLCARGLDVIVVDHHLVPDQPLPALAFINPNRPDCNYPYKHLASCGLVLSLAGALRKELAQALDLRPWLDLVAMGTIADVAPLDGDNRILVRAGLKRLEQAERPGVRALLELAGLKRDRPISGVDVAFRLAPRLNTPGRLERPDTALQLLLARSDPAAGCLAAKIEQLSLARRRQQDQMLQEAVAEVEQRQWSRRAAIVVGRRGWNHGIAGIVAARLMERYGCPVAAIGFDDSGTGRGSVRGPAGSRLYDALHAVKDVLSRFGGHQAAAGLEVRQERLDDLRDRFEAACAALNAAGNPGADGPETELFRLCTEDSLSQVIEDLERLEPCGHGNPAPWIAAEGQIRVARQVRGGHLRLELELPAGGRLNAFGVGMGGCAGQLHGMAGIAGPLRRDLWRGGDAVELKLERLLSY